LYASETINNTVIIDVKSSEQNEGMHIYSNASFRNIQAPVNCQIDSYKRQNQ